MNAFKRFKVCFLLALTGLMGLVTALPAQATAGSTWCPLLATAYGDPSCTPLSGSLQTTVDEAKADGRPGTIYALGGTTFNESVVANKLKGVVFAGGTAGGTTTITGSMTISNSSMIAFSTFTVNGGIKILNGKGAHQLNANIAAVTVQGGKFTSGTISDGVSSWTLQNALRIFNHTGAITLIGVRASNAISNGAVLGPTDGSPMVVSRSQFNGNTQTGLVISGGSGTITVTDVSATKNKVYGAYLLTTGPGPLTINTGKTRLNHFDKNSNCGLQASAAGTGPLNVSDVSASGNGQCGAILFASSGAITLTTGRSRGNHFDKNGQYGLTMTTPGPISAADLSASKNGAYGAQMDNAGGSGDLAVDSVHGKRNAFDRNGQYGLLITSKGMVSLRNLSASRNSQFGAEVVTSSGSVSLLASKGRNTFDRNIQFGLLAASPMGLVAHDVSASRNGQFGAQLISSASVNLSAAATRRNVFDRNVTFGLLTNSSAGQTLIDLSASRNGLYGLIVGNTSGLATLTTSRSKQNQLSSNLVAGMTGSSAGGFDIHNTAALKNGASGVYDGFNLTTSNASVTLTCSAAKNNTGNGLFASLGTGTLYLKSFTATGNGTDINLFSGLGPDVSAVSCP